MEHPAASALAEMERRLIVSRAHNLPSKSKYSDQKTHRIVLFALEGIIANMVLWEKQP